VVVEEAMQMKPLGVLVNEVDAFVGHFEGGGMSNNHY
jgi:hypothetical protein